MDIVRLREKIVEFTKTDWKKYPTYEHALQEWAESLLEEETKGLKTELKTAYPNEALGINDIIKYSHKLFDTFEKLEFRPTFNKAVQAFYLEIGLYVVRSKCMGKYQYTLVEASSEEMAIGKCI